MLGIAIKLSNYNTIGRTNDYILKIIKWISIKETYQLSIQNFTHKLLNSDNFNRQFLAEIITENRSIRMLNQNKLCPKKRLNQMTNTQ